MMASILYTSIKNCHTLQTVEIYDAFRLNYLLDVIEANLYVKQWVITFNVHYFDIIAKIKLKAMLSQRNDNSLVVYKSSKQLNNFVYNSNTFRVDPVSYC